MARAAWIGALGAALVGGSGCLAMGREEASERVREAGPITRVDVEVDAGTVRIVGAAEGTGANGVVTSRWTDTAPEVVHYVEDGVLHILGRCDAYAVPCLLDVNLTVPTTANVGIDTGRGDVTVRSVQGDVEVTTGEGVVDAHDLGGTVFIETEGGDITAESLSGLLIDARTQVGDVTLKLTAVPTRVVGRTEDGDVTVLVPAGRYRVESDTPKGDYDVSSGVVEDPASKSVIVADSANGDVRIQTRDSGQGK